MPIYEYTCKICGVMELNHRVDITVEKCPYCGGNMTRKYSPVGIVFKGKGFYKNDKK